MLAELIHKIAAQEYKEKENSSYHPRPSLAGPDRCIRQMVYWNLKTPAKPLPGRGVMIFNDSSWHEELTADWIRKSSYKLHSQQMKVTASRKGYSFVLNGRIDGIVEDMQGIEYLFEHKAVSHFSWQEMAKGNVSADYLSQMCLYMSGLEKVSPTYRAILLVKNKNTAQYLEFLITYSNFADMCIVESMTNSIGGMETIELKKEYPFIVESCFSKFKAIEEFASKKELPKRQYEVDHWRCDYCAYHQTCWEGYEKEFQALGTEAELQEAEDLCAYYLETSGHILTMSKEKDMLKAKIKKVLADKGAREGTTKRYIVTNKLIKSLKIDKSLIPVNILPDCQKESFSERLNIRLKKEAKNGKKTD